MNYSLHASRGQSSQSSAKRLKLLTPILANLPLAFSVVRLVEKDFPRLRTLVSNALSKHLFAQKLLSLLRALLNELPSYLSLCGVSGAARVRRLLLRTLGTLVSIEDMTNSYLSFPY